MPAEGGTMKASASVPLGPPTCKNHAVKKPPVPDRPKQPTKGQKGTLTVPHKEAPLNKEAAVSREHPNLVWKKLCWAEDNEMAPVACRQGSATGTGSSSLAGAPQTVGTGSSSLAGAPQTVGTGRSSLAGAPQTVGRGGPQTLSVTDKQLSRPSNAILRGPRFFSLLRGPHVNAKGDQPGMHTRATSGTSKSGMAAGLKRSKKSQHQPFLSKGHGWAVAHGDMDHKKKAVPKSTKAKLPNLVDLDLGDLIEIFRLAYQHWAIYVGNGYVIHLAPPSEVAGAGCASLMSTLTNKAVVKKERLLNVVGSDRYRVNNKHDSTYDPLPINKIIQLAEEKVGQELEYKVTSENCEHFVTELRYGVARSDQVRDFFVGATIAGLAGLFVGVGTAMVRRKKQQNQ